MPKDNQSVRRADARDGTQSAADAPEGLSSPFPPVKGDTLPNDPVVEAYKRDIDRTLLRQNLRRTVTERVENLIALQRLAAEAVRAGRSAGKDP